MDHIHSLLIMEDDLGEEGTDTETTPVPHPAEVDAGPSGSAQLVVACMLQVQSKCHKQLKINAQQHQHVLLNYVLTLIY